MGVFWRSHAEIATTEPERIKELVEEISQASFNDDSGLSKTTAPVYDVHIQGNSVFFSSNGYGCYGIEPENPGPLLFEKLFEAFDGALVCFEAVIPCQSQGYHMSSTWMKAEGEIDWEDEDCFGKYLYKSLDDGDLNEDNDEWDFEIVDVWNIALKMMEDFKHKLPHLFQSYSNAKAAGFEDWDFSEDEPDKPLITYRVACELAEEYSENEDLVLEDCEKDMEQAIREEDCLHSLSVELPDDFPELQMLSTVEVVK